MNETILYSWSYQDFSKVPQEQGSRLIHKSEPDSMGHKAREAPELTITCLTLISDQGGGRLLISVAAATTKSWTSYVASGTGPRLQQFPGHAPFDSPVTTFLPLRPPGQPVAFSPVARRALGNGAPSFDGQPPEPRHRRQHIEVVGFHPVAMQRPTLCPRPPALRGTKASRQREPRCDVHPTGSARQYPCPGCDCWW